jgi:crotonobetainyl-CoA:carnitine CoA-transferase CaiB-like acyl-CoA transferase
MNDMLTGVRVLDLSRLLPGGYCTQLLADLGAEVIKVETPLVGDYARIAPPEFGGDELFKSINRGKKSLAVNFRNPRGREVFLKLVENVDVVFETFRPGLVERWGIDYETVRALNPQVVYCSLTGYGQEGPYRDRAGHDLNYTAVGGLLEFNGAPGGPPIPLGVQVADMGGAMAAAVAILSGLVSRAATGQGSYHDVGMMDVVASWAMPVIGALYFATGKNPGRGTGALSGGLPCYNVYQAADGEYLSLGIIEPPLWTTFCKTVDREAWIGRQWETAAIPEVAALFRTRPREAWLDLFEGLEVCLEPLNTFEAMVQHPQVRQRGLVLEGPDGEIKGVKTPVGQGTAWQAPALGKHTHEILTAAGYSEADLDALEAKRLIRRG